MAERRRDPVAVALERVDAQIERRAARERGALGGALGAEHTLEMRIEPFRIIAGHPGRRTLEIGGIEACTLRRRSAARRKAPAIRQRRDRSAVELALEPQHAEHDGARAALPHDMGARRPPAQRVIDQTRDRRAIARSRRSGAPGPNP